MAPPGYGQGVWVRGEARRRSAMQTLRVILAPRLKRLPQMAEPRVG